MITEKICEEAFEKYWEYEGKNLDGGMGFKFCMKHSMQAAFKLLMPIIEKQNEALVFYGEDNNWVQHHDSGLSVLGDRCTMYHPDDYEDISGNSCLIKSKGGKRARATLKQVEEELKNLGAVTNYGTKNGENK